MVYIIVKYSSFFFLSRDTFRHIEFPAEVRSHERFVAWA